MLHTDFTALKNALSRVFMKPVSVSLSFFEQSKQQCIRKISLQGIHASHVFSPLIQVTHTIKGVSLHHHVPIPKPSAQYSDVFLFLLQLQEIPFEKMLFITTYKNKSKSQVAVFVNVSQKECLIYTCSLSHNLVLYKGTQVYV